MRVAHSIPAVVVAAALALPAGAAAQALAPGIPPAGANDFSCKPTAERPFPMILLHGTFGDMTSSFLGLAPVLKERGFCTFALDYGNRAIGPIDASANQIADFARRVLNETGAAKVSFVGHSQGGMIGRYVARFKGLAERIDDVVGLAPSNHGTTLPLVQLVELVGCVACGEQEAGSELVQRLNTGDETPPPVSYTTIATRYDEIVTPYRSQALAGDPSEVTNVVLQDRCPADLSDHVTISIPGDAPALQWTLNALERPGPANARFEPDCSGLTLGHDPDPVPPGAASGLSVQLTVTGRVQRVRRGGILARCSIYPPTSRHCSVSAMRRGRRLGRGGALLVEGSALVRVSLNRRGRRLVRRARGLRVRLVASVRQGALTHQAQRKTRLMLPQRTSR